MLTNIEANDVQNSISILINVKLVQNVNLKKSNDLLFLKIDQLNHFHYKILCIHCIVIC